jgi:site-specific recombinase XerD
MKIVKNIKTEVANSKIDMNSIIERAKEIQKNIHSENTRSAIQNDLKCFEDFCIVNQFEISQTSFFIYLSEISKNCKFSTLKRKASNIKKYIKDVDLEKLKLFLKGANNTICLTNSKKQAKALTKDILINSKVTDTAVSLIEKRNKALVLLSFWGAFRTSEIINLKMQNIEFHADGLLIRIENSKTDKEKKGLYKFIPYHFKDKNFCAVTFLKDYLSSANIETDYIFVSIHKNNKVTKNQLNRSNTNTIVKSYFNESYSTHSLRAGFVTTASESGATIQQIMQQTNHKSVQTVIDYVRSTDVKKNNAVNLI